MDGYAGDLFQSTLPVKGATIFRTKFQIIHVISIHAPREGSDNNVTINLVTQGISIHAPREGSDNTTYSAVLI